MGISCQLRQTLQERIVLNDEDEKRWIYDANKQHENFTKTYQNIRKFAQITRFITAILENDLEEDESVKKKLAKFKETLRY